jgi:hypothetical protein
MSTYNNQLWAKMVTDWVMSGPHSGGDVPAETPTQHGSIVPRNDREANASPQVQAAAA